jgi:hypothetical protein
VGDGGDGSDDGGGKLDVYHTASPPMILLPIPIPMIPMISIPMIPMILIPMIPIPIMANSS